MVTITIRPMDPQRREKWINLFGADHLPVLNAIPRMAEFRTGAELSYDLRTQDIHPAQLDRIAAYIANRDGRQYSEVREQLADGWTIPAAGLIVTIGSKVISHNDQPLLKRLVYLLGRSLYAKRIP